MGVQVLCSISVVLVGVLAFLGLGVKTSSGHLLWVVCWGMLSGSRSTPFVVVGVVPPCGCLFCVCGVGGCVVGGLFVNCIVVVSIFSVFLFCVILLFSFCGHSVDALAPRADEGRCGLRYASGSWRASV